MCLNKEYNRGRPHDKNVLASFISKVATVCFVVGRKLKFESM